MRNAILIALGLIVTTSGCQGWQQPEDVNPVQAETPHEPQASRSGDRLTVRLWLGEDGSQQPSGSFWDEERHESCTFQPIWNSNDVRCLPSIWTIKEVDTFVNPTCEGPMAGPSSFGNHSYVLAGSDLILRSKGKTIGQAYAFNEEGECSQVTDAPKGGWYQWDAVNLDVFVKASVERDSE